MKIRVLAKSIHTAAGKVLQGAEIDVSEKEGTARIKAGQAEKIGKAKDADTD